MLDGMLDGNGNGMFDGMVDGVVRLKVLERWYHNGLLNADTNVWRAGMPDWDKLSLNISKASAVAAMHSCPQWGAASTPSTVEEAEGRMIRLLSNKYGLSKGEEYVVLGETKGKGHWQVVMAYIVMA